MELKNKLIILILVIILLKLIFTKYLYKEQFQNKQLIEKNDSNIRTKIYGK